MYPVDFKEANKMLMPPKETKLSDNIIGIDLLPVWTDNEQVVSCWKMNWRERLSALIFGKAWLAVLSGTTQPPVHVEVGRAYLREAEDA